MKITKLFPTLAVTGTLMAFAIGVCAQPGGGQPGQQGGGGFGGRGGGGGFGLDDQQRQLLREANQRDSEQYQKLDEQLRAAQKELMKVVLAEQYEEKIVKEKADVVSKIQTEMLMIRSKAFSTVAPTLTPDQRTQLVDSRFGVMMLTGGGGMDIMGGRGGFGGGQGNATDPNVGGGRGNRGGFGGGNPGDPNFGGRGGRGGGAPGAADPNAGGRGGRDRGGRDSNNPLPGPTPQTPPR
jgi:Spy/CpxP family protein refolding chaperone